MTTKTIEQIVKSRLISKELISGDAETIEGTVTSVTKDSVIVSMPEGLSETFTVNLAESELKGIAVGAKIVFNRETGNMTSFTNPEEVKKSSARTGSSTKIASQPLI